MNALEQNLRTKTTDELANIGIRLASIIERGKECGASSKAECDKLQLIDQILRERQKP